MEDWEALGKLRDSVKWTLRPRKTQPKEELNSEAGMGCATSSASAGLLRLNGILSRAAKATTRERPRLPPPAEYRPSR